MVPKEPKTFKYLPESRSEEQKLEKLSTRRGRPRFTGICRWGGHRFDCRELPTGPQECMGGNFEDELCMACWKRQFRPQVSRANELVDSFP